MLAQNKFIRLDVKQKIYKIAYAIREQESCLKSGGKLDLSVIRAYRQFTEPDRHFKRMQAVLPVVDQCLLDLDNASSDRERVKILNFCFHDILEILDEPVGEKFYQIRVFDTNREVKRFPVVGILDNLRSAFNVGNMFRTADGFGVERLCLCGITPRPPSLKIERTAMGTLDHVPYRYYPQTAEVIRELKDNGYRIYAVETVTNSLRLSDLSGFERTAFVFGNEEFGVTDEVLRLCDDAVEVPLFGVKNSINVANIFAVVMYEAMNHLSDAEK